jgi:GNAT superfamily N-acetyltransferase
MGQAVLQHNPVDGFRDDLYQDPRADVKITDLGYGEVWIDLFYVHPAYRGLGIGKDAVAATCANADAWGVVLRLKAITMDEMMSQGALERFYMRNGFRIVRRDEQGMPTMERYPS